MEEALEEHRRRKDRRGGREVEETMVVGDVRHHAFSAFAPTLPVVQDDTLSPRQSCVLLLP